MPTPRRCSGCGAALGDPTDDDLTIVCRFCGLRHDINDLAGDATPVVVQVRAPGTGGAGRAIATIVLLVVSLTVAGGLYLASRATREVTTRVRETTDAVRQRVADRNRPLALTELDTLTEFAWKPVGTAPPPGGFSSFDPVAALPWAMSIAHAWAPDAVLTRIDVGRVSPTGVVDLSGDTPSGYRFHSPARLLRWKQETDGGTKSTTASGMMLQVQGTAVRVLMETNAREEPATSAPASLRLADLLTKARTARGFSDRPFYAGYMIFLPREGWAWYFRAPSGDSFPRVRAKDGRVYPF
jgi:hypothetical protein